MQSCCSSIYVCETTPDEVIHVASSFDKMTSGIDGIPDKMIKQCITNISLPLTDIVNSCFQTGTFPEGLKIAKVVPIHKEGDKCRRLQTSRLALRVY